MKKYRFSTQVLLNFLLVIFVAIALCSCGSGGGGGSSSGETGNTEISQRLDDMTSIMENGAQQYKNNINNGGSQEEAVNLTVAWLKEQNGINNVYFAPCVRIVVA